MAITMLSSSLPILSILFIVKIHSVISYVPPTLKSVEVGGCANEMDELVFCAAFEEECDQYDNLQFETSTHLREFYDNTVCSTEEIPLGTCKSTGKCAITKDSCLDPTDFIPPNSNSICNANGSTMNGNFFATRYGGCKEGLTNEIICAVRPEDCTFAEAWIPPSVVEKELKGGCRCHDVQVGVCTGNWWEKDLYKCAISEDDCDRQVPEFQSAREVMNQLFKDCRLCPYDERLVGGSLSASDSTSSTSTKAKKINNGSTLSTGALSGVVVASVIVMVGVFLSVYVKTKPLDKSPAHSEKDTEGDVPSVC